MNPKVFVTASAAFLMASQLLSFSLFAASAPAKAIFRSAG